MALLRSSWKPSARIGLSVILTNDWPGTLLRSAKARTNAESSGMYIESGSAMGSSFQGVDRIVVVLPGPVPRLAADAAEVVDAVVGMEFPDRVRCGCGDQVPVLAEDVAPARGPHRIVPGHRELVVRNWR